jgi:hypothetical protein
MTAVRLTVAAQPAVAAAACELCAVGPVTVADAVVIYRADGATVTLGACERCARSAHVVRVYGQPRTDGTWAGWLEFVAVGAPIVLRTGTETTQSDRAALVYWAGGLEPTYLEGAFARARRRGRRRAPLS